MCDIVCMYAHVYVVERELANLFTMRSSEEGGLATMLDTWPSGASSKGDCGALASRFLASTCTSLQRKPLSSKGGLNHLSTSRPLSARIPPTLPTPPFLFAPFHSSSTLRGSIRQKPTGGKNKYPKARPKKQRRTGANATV